VDAQQTLVQTMAKTRNSDDLEPRTGRHVPGPLEGYRLGATDIPVRIFDLSLDGCMVEMSFGTLSGKGIRLQIDLPGEGWTVVQCETLHIAGHNAFAVKFVRLSDQTRISIERVIGRLLDRSTEDDASVTNGEANDD
jgi:PilZ domain